MTANVAPSESTAPNSPVSGSEPSAKGSAPPKPYQSLLVKTCRLIM